MSAPGSGQQPHPSDVVMQIAFGFVASTCLNAVAEFGIPDMLEKGPQNVAKLASAAGVREDLLYRVLRTLSSLGIFRETEARTFALTPLSEQLLTDRPGSMRDAVRFAADPWHTRMYGHVMEVLKTGKTAPEVALGMNCFDAFAADPPEQARFNAAMTSMSANLIPPILEAFDFGGIRTLVDVAGGHGFVLSAILQKYPAMQGILMDLDHVVEGAKPRIQQLGLTSRMKTTSGDFFKEVPKGGDAYIMKFIIHDWDDERAALILRNIRTALQGVSGGKVILLEAVVPPGNEPHMVKMLDIEMMMLPGGKERTQAEYAELFQKTGFVLKQVVPTKGPLSVIVADAV